VLLSLPLAAQDLFPTETPLSPSPTASLTPAPTATGAPLAPAPVAPAPRTIPGLDPTIIQRADLDLHAVQLQIERIQTQRLANRAPLIQLPSTHALPPGELGAVPDPARRVGIDSWYSAAVDLPAQMYASVRVDVYEGPQGLGYVLIADLVQVGQRWHRRINIGPETRRSCDWQMIEAEP